MSDTIGFDDVVRMLRTAAARVRDDHEMLSKLDSFGGDGDHGTTMVRAVGRIETVIDGFASQDVKALLSEIGWAVMGVDGGATGPLFGMFFMGMSEAAPAGGEADAAQAAAMFEAGLTSVRAQTKAQIGDKTMIDALVPGVEALRGAVDEGADAPAALSLAADAAEQGARSTEALKPSFGRAKNTADQSLGHADPGATSVSLMFRGFADAFAAAG